MPSSPLHTRGPLPARVYWTRRLVVLGLAMVVVVALARVLGSFSDGSDPDNDEATIVGATTSDTTETTPSKADRRARRERKKRRTPTETPLAEPSGPCVSSDIVVTPVIAAAEGAKDVPIALNLRTLTSPACTWTVSAETLTVSITSGDDFIWGSRQCPTSIPTQDLVLRQSVDTPVVVTWDDARRSDEDCSAAAGWALPGYYHVSAATLGGEPTDVQFELIKPASVVITKTVTPKPEPEPGGKQGGKQSDTEHTPGEQGDGNSDG